MTELIFTFGERLRLARRRTRLTQARLAKKIGVHESTVSRWERDHSTEEMAVKYLMRIAAGSIAASRNAGGAACLGSHLKTTVGWNILNGSSHRDGWNGSNSS